MDSTVNAAGVVSIPGWQQYPWLRHGFSTRSGGVSTVYRDGDLNLGYTKDDSPEAVRENRRRVVEAVSGEAGWPLIAVRQVHGTEVRIVHADEPASVAPASLAADGLITAAPHLMLGIQVADCVPVLVADTHQRIVAAFHAGWRGTAAAIVRKGVERLKFDFGSRSDDLIGALGPSIGACCYSVGEEVHQAFTINFSYGETLFVGHDGNLHLDLAAANRRQLLDAGLSAASISVLGACTGCAIQDGARKYFSHRKENGFTGRAMGLIGIA